MLVGRIVVGKFRLFVSSMRSEKSGYNVSVCGCASSEKLEGITSLPVFVSKPVRWPLSAL